MSTLIPTKSQEIFAKSCAVIAGGVNSPVRAFIGLDVDPVIVEKGKGDTIWDADGKPYIDYCMSWGSLLHGHAPSFVVEKVIQRLADGSSFGIATAIEEELARQIVNILPGMDKLRFVSSGTEATMTAVRLARGYTKRPLIVKFNGNYHGHADSFLVQAGSSVSQLSNKPCSEGVLQDIAKNTISLPYNDSGAVKQLFRDSDFSSRIAGVIVEPIAANMGVVSATHEFLELLRKETDQLNAVLIFDEVISGFRVGLQGAQGLYEVQPDLTCLGKIIGGGFPAAAFGGKKEIMDHLAPTGGVYQAGTLSGNPVAMQAGLETLKKARSKGFYNELEEKTRFITEPVRMVLKERNLSACIQEAVGMFTLFWGPRKVRGFEDLKKLDKKRFKTVFKILLNNEVYSPPSPYEAWFLSAAHKEKHLRKTRDLLIECIKNV